MSELSTLLEGRGIEFDPLDRRIRCLAHISHLSCTRVIRAFSTGKTPSAANEDEETSPDDSVDIVEDSLEVWSGERMYDDAPATVTNPKVQTYEEALARDPHKLLRTFISKLRASGQRRDAYWQALRDGNAKCLFIDASSNPPKAVLLPERELILDSPTRWDSTYAMLKRYREQKAVSR